MEIIAEIGQNHNGDMQLARRLIAEAKAAFQVLVNALVEQQNAGDIRRDDPVLMARFVWALVHGTALLFIDGQLPEPAQRAALEPYLAERIYASIRQPT